MRRIVRRTDTVVTVQTWTLTWTEDIPVSQPSPAGAMPALPPSAAPAPHPDLPAPATPPTPPDSD